MDKQGVENPDRKFAARSPCVTLSLTPASTASSFDAPHARFLDPRRDSGPVDYQTATPVLTRAMTREEIAAKISLAEANLDRLLEWISRYDGKAVAILALDTAMLGYLASVAPPFSEWSWSFGIAMVASVGLSFASLLYLYTGSYPTTSTNRESLVFFGTIARKSERDFVLEFTHRTDESHLADVLAQCHRNSEIIDVKFARLKTAFVLMLATVPAWACSLYLILRTT